MKLNRKSQARTKADSEQKDEDIFVGQHSRKPNVGSRISSCPLKRLTCTDKHWSEMSGWEKIQAGPFLCFVNPDEYDKRQGKFVEFMILYNEYDEYVNLKNFAIDSGRMAELIR